MKRVLEIRVRVKPLAPSSADVRALRSLDCYDAIAFTSKNARRLFEDALRTRGIALPESIRILHVGPRAELLRFKVSGKRIIFPRSALAPNDIVHQLRARGAVVRAIRLYTASAVPLTDTERCALSRGMYSRISFSSPSGVSGLLAQLSPAERRTALLLPADCIGPTTAAAARIAGFTPA